MKTSDYLDAIKARHGKTSDYAIAKLLKTTTGKISDWRAGRTLPGPLACFKIAELIGEQPAGVIADIEAERAEKAAKVDDADEWKAMARKFGGKAAGILLAAVVGAGAMGGSGSAQAARSQCDSNFVSNCCTSY